MHPEREQYYEEPEELEEVSADPDAAEIFMNRMARVAYISQPMIEHELERGAVKSRMKMYQKRTDYNAQKKKPSIFKRMFTRGGAIPNNNIRSIIHKSAASRPIKGHMSYIINTV